MSIYKTSVNKPVTTILVFVAVIIIGIFSLSKLPIDQFPEMEPPFITIMTTYQGANASEVETNITKLVENSLNSVDGLKNMTSSSKDNISIVSLELEWGTNMDEAMNDIRSFIDILKNRLPSGASNPNIFKFSTSAMPIIQYAFTAKESYPGLDKILNEDIIPRLNRIEGIGNISLSGSPERYVYVNIDQSKLDTYGIPLEMVGNAISGNNLNLSSGTVKMGKEQYQMEVRSEYVDSKEIEGIVVSTTREGRQVFVRDIATVKDTLRDLALDEKINSSDGVRMVVTKQSGSNTVKVCDNVQKEMAKIQKELSPDIKSILIYNSSDDIKNSIYSLQESILYALLFVVFVVFLFLGKWRPTLIISLAIPISLVGAFIYLLATGGTLNIISLSSLTIAIGMVVDDAIVVLENITRHLDRGASPREAAIYATNEVWTAVIASTLVIIAVFVPLTMLEGMAGVLFKELGWIVAIVISISVIVSITLTPMLSSKLLKSKKIRVNEQGQIEEVVSKLDWYQKYVVAFFDKLDRLYANSLRYCVNHKAGTLIVVLLIFIASLLPVISGKIGSDFMQETDNGRLSVSVELQRGTRLEETLKTARILEERFQEIAPEIRYISTTAGSNEEAGFSALFSSTTNNKISMTVVCNKKYDRERSIFDIAEQLRKEMDLYPEITRYKCNASSGMGGGSSAVNVEIYGYDFNETNAIAAQIRDIIKGNIPAARDIMISRDEDRPELKIVVNKEKLAYSGLTPAMVSGYVRNRVSGMRAGFLKEDGDEYNIIVRLEEKDRNSITSIENISIPTATGKSIKLSEVASIEEHWAPPTIARKNRQRMVSVDVTPYNVSLGELASQIQTEVDKLSMPQGVTVRLAGQYENLQKTFSDLGMLLMLIVILVYVVMASQFESFKKPAIIMSTVPFALTGVILSLWITGTSLDMIGALGFVMLVGIVVKNGIVMVDYTNLMRDRGHELKEAIALAGQSRLRPVLMTAMTTMLGMLPMALSSGEGSEMWRPLGIVVIGGLLISTLITLFVVPTLYATMSRHGERNKEEKNRKHFYFMKLSVKDDNKE